MESKDITYEQCKCIIIDPAFKGRVKSLKDLPFLIPDDTQILCCENLDLTSLEGCPPNVTELKAQGNKLKAFDRHFPAGLIKVDVSHNNFTSLEGCPPKLQHLRVSNNPLETLKGCGQEMMSLGVSFTHLEDFEGCGPKVTDITAVQCCLKSFNGLPQDHKLNKLYASMNRFSTWEHCPVVLNLDLAGNRFESIRGCKEGVVELCLSYNKLRNLEGCPTSLEKLRVAGNCISKLDQHLDEVKKLKVLKINDNQLTQVVGRELPGSLERLFVQGNPVSETDLWFDLLTLKIDELV